MKKNQAINHVNTSESVKQELKTFTQAKKNLQERKQKLSADQTLVIDYGQEDIYDYLVIDEEQQEKRKNTIKIRYLSTDKSVFELTDQDGKKKLFKLNENNKCEEYDPKKDRQNQQKQPELPWYKRLWNKVFCCCKFSAEQTRKEEMSGEIII